MISLEAQMEAEKQLFPSTSSSSFPFPQKMMQESSLPPVRKPLTEDSLNEKIDSAKAMQKYVEEAQNIQSELQSILYLGN